ncbi:glycogen synthase GlgA [Roseospira marina]|uniref:Glycogen synthase n=1 Tax=Roseospira marina TaxID=140057 RepID=A0A5M6IGQ1_9PROT|nr:glycogen synthase GlgA [Roseospira marina]KAA5607404.1 glycogen synthase GlgA [Roseospira marina]MBB4312423.1 starch synthase [Roseospira marina]MBB5085561.1 starch synthase [Roseospira marina]
MRVLFVTSEAHPLVKTGGLADVSGALPVALTRLGVDARILMPAYAGLLDRVETTGPAISLGEVLPNVWARLIPATEPATGQSLLLIDCPPLFERPGGPYLNEYGHDWPDNFLRFGLLGRVGAMVAAQGVVPEWVPDVVHASDWQAGLTAAYLWLWGVPRPRTVFTVHNLHYQGIFGREILPMVGLPDMMFGVEGLEFYGHVSYLKAGLYYSHFLTTVSPTYAREIQTQMGGEGLHGLLSSRGARLQGILNGVDQQEWNPTTDPYIAAPFDAENLDGKAVCKAALQRELGLAERPDAPLFGVVSRFVEQKGIDLALSVISTILDSGGQIVILGSGDPGLEWHVQGAAGARPDAVAARIGYDEGLSHRIQAGSDALLVPSRFEPCGLTQMYAMRYGTLPVVRRTGGLADTVIDVAEAEMGTGIVFDHADPGEVIHAVRRTVELYRDRETWAAVVRHAMTVDHGWDRVASDYLGLYSEVLHAD